MVYINIQLFGETASPTWPERGYDGGQAPAHKYIDKLMTYVTEGKVKLDDIITHRLPLSQISHAYEIFKKKEDDCVKVVLDPSR